MATARILHRAAVPTAKPQDVVTLLKAGHRKAAGPFAQFEKITAAWVKKKAVAGTP